MRYVAWVVMALISANAWAYVPPSDYIAKRIAQQHSGFKLVCILSEVVELVDESPNSNSFQDLSCVDYGKHVVESEGWLNETDRIFSARRDLNDILNALIFEDRKDALFGALLKWGIPMRSEADLAKFKDEKERRQAEVSMLARQPDGYVWVYGANNTEELKQRGNYSRLWIQKDSFLPLRVTSGDRLAGRSPFELQLTEYRTAKGFAYANQAQYLLDGKAIWRREVKRIDVNTRPKELGSTMGTGLTPLGHDLSSSMKSFVQNYYSNLR